MTVIHFDPAIEGIYCAITSEGKSVCHKVVISRLHWTLYPVWDMFTRSHSGSIMGAVCFMILALHADKTDSWNKDIVL